MAVLLRLRRTLHTLTNPHLLHYRRLLSTSNSTFSFTSSLNLEQNVSTNFQSSEQFEKKWKQLTVSLLILRDRYATDGRLLSEMIKSRQAFINDTIQNLSVLSALPSYPTLLPPPQTPEILSEKLKNLNRLDRLMRLKGMLVKEDEMSAELNNSRVASLQEIINNLSEIRRRPWPLEDQLRREKRNELNERLMRLRKMEMNSNSNPTSLSQMLQVFCEQMKTLNMTMSFKEMMVVMKDELPAEFTNFRLTSLEFDEIIKNISPQTSLPPPRLDDGWREKWFELNESWSEFNERRKRLMEMEMEKVKVKSKYPILMPRLKKMLVKENELCRHQTSQEEIMCWRLKTLNESLRLKEMLVKEDELSAELTNSRLTSLQEIIKNFFEIQSLTSVPPLRRKWNELNEGLMRLREMEVEDAEFLAVRTNGGLDSVSQSIKNLIEFRHQISGAAPKI